jgi:hypothetical protein
MTIPSAFYLTVHQTAEGFWRSAMRTRAWGRDEPWAYGSFQHLDRRQAEREARLWAGLEGYRYVPPAEAGQP